MADEIYDPQKIDQAIATFESADMGSQEAFLASARIFSRALERFKKDAPAFRERIGEAKIRDFATQELNDTIYEIQDAIPVAVRLFNSLMRDPDGKE